MIISEFVMDALTSRTNPNNPLRVVVFGSVALLGNKSNTTFQLYTIYFLMLNNHREKEQLHGSGPPALIGSKSRKQVKNSLHHKTERDL